MTNAELDIRTDRLSSQPPEVAAMVRRLVPMAVEGLGRAFLEQDGGCFPQTMRGRSVGGTHRVEPEGVSARYTAVALLGLNRLPLPVQRGVLAGASAREQLPALVRLASTDGDPGALALAAWAVAEISGTAETSLMEKLAGLLLSGQPLPVVDVSWMLTAALLGEGTHESTVVIDTARARLIEAQGPHGIFPHWLPANSQSRYRRHVGCFADQVYPLQALARLHTSRTDTLALTAANATASRICHRQGEAGQWWWFYDSRDGSVVEGYPVYSVHQHAMAPMALFDLSDAGGEDHATQVGHGLSWLATHPEVEEDLVDENLGLVWRKVGRREPRKLSRGLGAATTALRPGLHLRIYDRLMPPTRVDRECRPYELGWLLYAWLRQPAIEGGLT